MISHLNLENGQDFIYADPDNALYDDLDLNRGVATTFFSPATPFAFRDKIFGADYKGGSYNFSELFEVLGKWNKAVYVPPKQEQAFNQGGTFIFDGDKTLFTHYDEATAAHADLETVVQLAMDAASDD